VIVYLDTSVVLRVLFGQKPSWKGWARWQEAWTSELMGLEARRAIFRLRLESALDDRGVAQAHQSLKKIERGVGTIGLTRSVLRRAGGPMPTPVKTLDAIHLASSLMFGEQRDAYPKFVTFDQQQSIAARALGFDVLGAAIP
jgi:predicted nucleic acid-binding protein